MRDIHYLWIGTPTKTDPHAIAGHDVAGSISMAKEMEQQGIQAKPIKFWCLDQYADEYRKQFQEAGVKIEVCTIESLIEAEKQKELSSQAKFLSSQLDELRKNMDKVGERVKFKDVFSIFLLVSQAGYLLDTNVFPEAGKKIELTGEQESSTARSPDGMHDFYFMYSPARGDVEMRKALDKWIADPSFGKTTVFDKQKIKFIDPLDSGVRKISYKSYQESNIKGLFFWLNISTDELKKHVEYADVNAQIANPSSIKLLGDVKLLQGKHEPDDLPSGVTHAFTLYSNPATPDQCTIYFVDKQKNTVEQVYQGKFVEVLFSFFMHQQRKYPVTLKEVSDIMRLSNTEDAGPQRLVNVDRCTVLHQAVLMNDAEKVKVLLDAGARLDLTANYKIMPGGETIEVTPKELAERLGHKELVALLSQEQKAHPAKFAASTQPIFKLFDSSQIAVTSDDLSSLMAIKSQIQHILAKASKSFVLKKEELIELSKDMQTLKAAEAFFKKIIDHGGSAKADEQSELKTNMDKVKKITEHVMKIEQSYDMKPTGKRSM